MGRIFHKSFPRMNLQWGILHGTIFQQSYNLHYYKFIVFSLYRFNFTFTDVPGKLPRENFQILKLSGGFFLRDRDYPREKFSTEKFSVGEILPGGTFHRRNSPWGIFLRKKLFMEKFSAGGWNIRKRISEHLSGMI